MAADRYANQRPRKAAENDRPHNPRSPLVLGERKESDAVHDTRRSKFFFEMKRNTDGAV